jgi:preprotein translocase subunit YajC
MGAVFYFLLIRPQQRRQKAMRQLLETLEVDDDVITIGGMFGTIREIDDDGVVLEVANGVEIRFLRTAIARRLNLEDESELDEDEEVLDEDEAMADEEEEGRGADEKR